MTDAATSQAGNEFDIVVLGAGSGGYACALRAAQLGLTVALVEKGNLGGTCLHVGCIPTKALLHAAEVAESARESEQFGVKATFDGIDMAGVNAYKDGVVSRLFKGLTGLIKSRGITVVEGEGRLTGPRSVEVVRRVPGWRTPRRPMDMCVAFVTPPTPRERSVRAQAAALAGDPSRGSPGPADLRNGGGGGAIGRAGPADKDDSLGDHGALPSVVFLCDTE